MRVAALNPRAPKFVAPNGVMTFGILPGNHSARVAKSQPEPAVDTKTIVPLAHRASTTTKLQFAPRAHVVTMHHQVVPAAMMHQQLVHLVLTKTKHQPVHHVHIEMKPQLAPRASTTTKHRLAPRAHVVMMHQQLVRHVLTKTKLQLARLVHIKTKHQLAHRALSAMKCMRQSRACLARRLQLSG